MTLTPAQQREIRDGIRAMVEPSGGVLNEQVLNDIFSFSEVDDPDALLQLQNILQALGMVVKGTEQ